MGKIFGDDFAKDPNLSKFKTPQDLVKSYKEIQSMASRPKYDIPAPDADPAVKSEFYKKLGVPENPDLYEITPTPDDDGNVHEGNAEFAKTIAQISHELNLTKDQAKGVHSFLEGLANKVNETEAARIAEEDQKLDEFFTKTFGDQKTVAEARIGQLIQSIVPEEMRSLMSDKIAGEALSFVALIDQHYQNKYGLADKNIGDQAGAAGAKGIDSLREDAKKLMGSPEYRDAMHPLHDQTKANVANIYKTIGELTKNQK